jgi:hypothetical protein
VVSCTHPLLFDIFIGFWWNFLWCCGERAISALSRLLLSHLVSSTNSETIWNNTNNNILYKLRQSIIQIPILNIFYINLTKSNIFTKFRSNFEAEEVFSRKKQSVFWSESDQVSESNVNSIRTKRHVGGQQK